MMEVKQHITLLSATETLTALLAEVSAITDYRTLRDSLPRRLARLLRCRCVLLYQRDGETLQLAAGSYDDSPGWSPALLSVAHINPIALDSNTLEAQTWRARRAITAPVGHAQPHSIAAPLLYRQRGIGVLVAIRESNAPETQPLLLNRGESAYEQHLPDSWASEEIQIVEVVAGILAMQLENTRLLERDRVRISELSLLNSISRQFNSSLHEYEQLRSIVVQRAREIAVADICDCLLAVSAPDEVAWFPSALREIVFQRLQEQGETSTWPLIMERSGDAFSSACFKLLPAQMKTLFVVPLWNSHNDPRLSTASFLRERRTVLSANAEMKQKRRLELLGVIVGGYYHPWKLRREEVMMLSVLANQASSALENIALVADVVEARNEARKLLRQVLDDQRFKEFILESIPGGLITVDLHGQITTVNRAAQSMLDYHSYEIMGQPAQKFFPSRTLQYVMQSGTPCNETLTITDQQGQERTLDVTFLPLRDDREQIIGSLATLSDVTLVRRLEEEKRRLDRLASLGEMAASVAHEVRNPLASIKTSMQMMLDDLSESTLNTAANAGARLFDDGMRDCVSVVLKEVERLDSIVRDLLLFSRPRSLHTVECNIVEICERVLFLIAARVTEANVVVHRVYLDVPPVQVDVAQMEQVLLNLCINALQAMSEGGILTISCVVRPKPVTDGFNQPGNELEITVNDTGTGIAPEQLERIFQPFYTTKAHGIGLGLPISRRLVEDHHGALSVASQPGYGTTFTIRLPLPDGLQGGLAQVDEEERLS